MQNSDVAALASKIYAAHSRALDILFEFRPDNLKLLTEEIEKLLKTASESCEIQLMHTTKGFVRFIPTAWATANNLLSPSWSVFICEINLVGGKATLKVFVEPACPAALRGRLHELAKQNKFPNTVNRTKAAEQWFTFYAVRGTELKLTELEPKEMADLAQKVWDWCKGQLADQKFSMMKMHVMPLLQELPGITSAIPEAPITGSLA
jgi:hypothetical protein